jgi:uncharacterized alpha/beta hydrolase family protein
MKKIFFICVIIFAVIISMFFVKITVKTPRGCIVAPCSQETKIPIGVYLLNKVFPNNFVLLI